MGVCEGTPQAVLHDHLGKADYHGATINQVGKTGYMGWWLGVVWAGKDMGCE